MLGYKATITKRERRYATPWPGLSFPSHSPCHTATRALHTGFTPLERLSAGIRDSSGCCYINKERQKLHPDIAFLRAFSNQSTVSPAVISTSHLVPARTDGGLARARGGWINQFIALNLKGAVDLGEALHQDDRRTSTQLAGTT